MRKLSDVEAELATAKEELANAGNPKSQLLCGDDDSYQENLELGWWIKEQQALIGCLELEIANIQATSGDLRYVNEEVGWVDQDEEYR